MNIFVTTEFIHQLAWLLVLAAFGFSLTMLLTPIYTYFAYRFKWWKVPRTHAVTGEAAPIFTKLHAEKHRRNIPMFAGVVFVVAICGITLALNLDRGQTWLPLAALIGGGLVGLIDDVINLRGLGGGIKGLRAPIKFALISAVGLMGAWFFFYKLGYNAVHLPFPPYDLELGWLLVPLFAFVVVATSNAVNITDGLDGLAGGLSAIAFGMFGAIAALQGNIGIAGFCFTVVGGLIAYMWFNVYPARFFMSDVGSFALGTALGVIAMLTDTLFLLPIIGFLFVIEAGSSLIQIFSKKIFKRKVFISAPIHHHFEAIGWEETKVTSRFWIIGLIFGMLGLLVALTGGYVA